MLIDATPRDQRPVQSLPDYGLVYRRDRLTAELTIAGEVRVTLSLVHTLRILSATHPSFTGAPCNTQIWQPTTARTSWSTPRTAQTRLNRRRSLIPRGGRRRLAGSAATGLAETTRRPRRTRRSRPVSTREGQSFLCRHKSRPQA
jgi:hypothetical protein